MKAAARWSTAVRALVVCCLVGAGVGASVVAGTGVLSCASLPPIAKRQRRPSSTAESRAQIVVLKSSDNQLYRLPVDLFVAQVPADVHQITIKEGQPAKEVLRKIDAIAPKLVVTLGARALALTQKYVTDLPVLFAMVLNHRRFDVAGRANFMGIELETPTMTEFTQFKMIVPELKRVLVIYGDRSTETLIEAARRDLATLDIELQAAYARDVTDVPRAFAEAPAGFDGIWILNDSVAMAPGTFKYLAAEALRARLPLMCSLSETFAREGALMSVSVDFRNLGSASCPHGHAYPRKTRRGRRHWRAERTGWTTGRELRDRIEDWPFD